VTVLAGAAYYILTGVASQDLRPLTIAGGQRIVGGALLLLAAAIPRVRGKGRRPPLTARHRRWLVVLSLTNVPLMACLVGGFVYSTASNATLIDRLDLPLALVLGWAFLGEPARRVDWILMAPLTLGVLLILEVWPGHWEPHLLGDLMFLVATALTVGNAVLIKRQLAGLSPWTIVRWNFALSAVWLMILQAVLEGRNVVLLVWDAPAAGPILLALGVLTLVEITAYYGLLHRLNIWHVRCILLFIPIVTVAVERLRQELAFAPSQWIGAAVVIVTLSILVSGHLPDRARRPL
jgi:drug/metabolite transporter (DMT)-like permease